MFVEFIMVNDEKGEYSDAFLKLEMPMPPRAGEWFPESEHNEEFRVKDVSYGVEESARGKIVVSSVVFCEPGIA